MSITKKLGYSLLEEKKFVVALDIRANYITTTVAYSVVALFSRSVLFQGDFCCCNLRI